MLRVPSLQGVLRETIATLKRFPLPILAGIVGAFAAIHFNHLSFDIRQYAEESLKIIMCCWLGLTAFISIQLFSESKRLSLLQNILIQTAALTLLVVYYFSLPHFNDFAVKDGIRYALYTIGLHLLVSFSAFIGNGTTNGFWQFNETLFIRILTSAIYTGVLYVGLALAILAVDELFNANVNKDFYGDLWFIMIGIFNTCFFLAGVPKHSQTLDSDTSYPKGLKIFTQFVLLPLVTIYMLILYAYGAKIAIMMELPRGWVSYLVISLSIAGILSLLLIWPIRNEEGNNWIKIADRWFYRALYPLIVLLGLAIYKRVSQYGITENRYFILLIALWLAAVATYFLISKNKNIKVIPVSLCIIAFLSSFGPWGAFSVSERSQVNRLEKLLIQENILVDGKIVRPDSLLRNENSASISSLVHYLGEYHSFESIQPWFNQNLDSLLDSKTPHDYSYKYHKKEMVLDLMGVGNYHGRYERSNSFYIVSEYQDQEMATKVTGFDYHQSFRQHYRSEERTEYYTPINFGKNVMHIKNIHQQLTFYLNDKQLTSIDFVSFIKTLQKSGKHEYNSYKVPPELFVLPVETDSLFIQLNFNSISGAIEENDSMNIYNIDTDVLIKHK